MKNNDFNSGQNKIEYMQPFPMRNTGWHRCVYILFEHSKPIDFNILQENKNNSSSSLKERSFKAADFHLNYKNDITPVGLSFFQTEYDLSVKNFFHNVLSICVSILLI
jgi:large subunit ribosomal protein L38